MRRFVFDDWAALVMGGLALQKNYDNGTWRGNIGSIPSPTMVTWLVDGNNLSCSRKVPNERETILRELSKIASPRGSFAASADADSDDPNKMASSISSVVIVFDGNEDEVFHRTVVDEEKWLEWTVTDGKDRRKDRADDWIVDRVVPDLRRIIDERLSEGKGTTRVHLVSADKDLQKRVGAARILNGGSFVHPPRFWKDYLPVLIKQQLKQQQKQ